MIATQYGHLPVVSALLEAKAEVNKAENDGWTSLYVAALKGHLLVVSVLLEAKAEVNQASTDGWTSLMIAAQKGCPRCWKPRRRSTKQGVMAKLPWT